MDSVTGGGDFGLRERFGRGEMGAMSSAARGVMEGMGDAEGSGGSLRIHGRFCASIGAGETG